MTSVSLESRRLRDAVRRFIVAHGALDHARRPCGTELSVPHAYALLEMLDAPQPLSVTQLAHKLAIDRTNVSRLVARMEADGEVERRRHPHDGRAWVLRLTALGRGRARGVDATSAAHFGLLSARLGDEGAVLLDAMEKLTAAMVAMGRAA